MSRPKVTALGTKTSTRPVGVALGACVGRQLEDRMFRDEFERRRMAHDLAIVLRSMREQAGLTQARSRRWSA